MFRCLRTPSLRAAPLLAALALQACGDAPGARVVRGVADSSTDSSADAQGATGEATAPDAAVSIDAGGPELEVSVPSCEVFDASALDDAMVAAGQGGAQVYSCFYCHQEPTQGGIVLNGNTSENWGTNVYPPNLTNSPQGLGCWTDDQIVTAILYGRDPEGGALCSPMPPWSKYGMDAGAAREIVAFLRSLPPSDKVVPPMTCSDFSDGGGDSASDAAVE